MHDYNFIDLFAGCGGKHNLCEKKKGFEWPKWLPCENMTTSNLLENYSDKLKTLEGKVFLIAGGPPCQGFSFAGLRNPNDPRNRLTEEYIKIVSLIKPKVLLLETTTFAVSIYLFNSNALNSDSSKISC